MSQSRDERNAKAKARMAEYRKTVRYQEWLIESREKRRALKEKYRRQKGAVPISEIKGLALKKKEEKILIKEERKLFKQKFVGPPTPRTAMCDADYARWRYQADGGEYQKQKRKRHIDGLTDSYVAQQLGMKVDELTDEIVALKKEQLLFSRDLRKLRKQLKEVSNGE